MAPVTPGLKEVPVTGGMLAVEVLPGTTEPVLAVHGISSHRRLWSWLRTEMPELTLVAPDLRGRADSLDVAGPSDVHQHVSDLVATCDALGLESVHVVGMSMGGFIAVELALRHPDRVKSLVLVDGGFPMASPPGLTPDLLPVVFKDRLDRLTQSWAFDDFVAFFTSSTAPLLDPSDALLLHYLEHDLIGGRDGGTVRLSGDALLGDAASVFFGAPDWQALEHPVRFCYAQWAIGADTSPAYPDVTTYAEKCLDVRYVEGVDHAGIIMSKAGAVVVAELVAKALV